MARVANVDLAVPRIGERVAARARRQDAIEHVDAARHRGEDIVGLADAHQIARLVGGKLDHGFLDGREHHVLRLAHREAADGIAVKADPYERARGFAAQFRHHPALHDAEQGAAGRRALEGALSIARPSAARGRIARSTSASDAGSLMHSSSCIAMSAPSRFWISTARSGESSNIAPSRCERKVTPCSLTFRRRRERHHLIAAGIGEVGCGQPMKVCKPPSAAMRSAPGRSIR